MAEKTMLIAQSTFRAIKISKWKIKEGSTLSIGGVLLFYDYATDGDNKKTCEQQQQRKLKSTQAGTVVRLLAHEGAVVATGEPLLELKPCIHPTVMKDMCAECGADLRRDDAMATTAASVPMVHSIPELKVSEELAQKLGKLDGERLLKDRKIVLLVDLDQTLIHTTNDNVPPNIRDVYHFQLCRTPVSPWYHTRLRPFTQKFLNNMSGLFELHICTFGARNYAHTIAMYLDPDQRFFSNRILSRDECFDPTSKKANLKALFPCGDNMVCIIDDREDVWSHASNLIHVKPYHFFQHTGDINAPPGLDKHEQDDKTGIDLTKLKPVNISANEGNASSLNGHGVKSDEKNNDVNDNTTGHSDNGIEVVDKKMKEESIESNTKDTNGSNGNGVWNVKKQDGETVEVELSTVAECADESKNEKGEEVEEVEASTCNKTDEGDAENICVDSESAIEDNNADKDQDSGKLLEGKHDDEIASQQATSESVNDSTDNESKEANLDELNLQNEQEEKPLEQDGENACEHNLEQSTTDSAKETQRNNSIEKLTPNEVVEENQQLEASSLEQQQIPSTEDKKAQNEPPNSATPITPTPQTTTSSNPTTLDIDDPDDYLLYLEDILRRIHRAFYDEYDRMESGDVPDLKRVIPRVRSNILSGTQLVFSGLVPTHIKLEQSKAYQVARSLGARVTQNLDETTTHIVAVRPGTAKVNAGRRKKNLKIVTPDWLWACAERWERVEEMIYPLNSKGSKNRHPPPHCSSPEHAANYSGDDDVAVVGENAGGVGTSTIGGNPAARKRTPSGRFMDTINPLMSFSSDDIADMDKEVEDILDDDSDTEDYDDELLEREEQQTNTTDENNHSQNTDISTTTTATTDANTTSTKPTSSDEPPRSSQAVTKKNSNKRNRSSNSNSSSSSISSSSSSVESLTAEYPRGFKRARRKSKFDDFDEDTFTKDSTTFIDDLRGDGGRCRGNSSNDDDEDDEFPSTKFRRGEELGSDLDFGQESNSEGSNDPPDEVDDGEWNMMGAALEREFLSNN